MTFTLLTATAFARGHDNMPKAVVLHVIAWIFQFIGHGFAEKRAPALLDNLVGGTCLPLRCWFITSIAFLRS